MTVAPSAPFYIGVDLGTSGCRAIAIDASGVEAGCYSVPLPPPRRQGLAVEQTPELWWEGVKDALRGLLARLPSREIAAVAVDGTSGTILLCSPSGAPLGPALMYDDRRAVAEAERIALVAPRESAAHGAGGGLAKALWLAARRGDEFRVSTQADWIAGRLTGRRFLADTNNALKLGYDPINHCWPAWLERLGVAREWLPEVVAPGSVVAPLDPCAADEVGLPRGATVVAGTTDSTAAIIATGVSQVGQAVTSLGSTLVTKVIAERPISHPEAGVYSQPFGTLWLVGGGSNSGGAVLRRYFDQAAIDCLTPMLDPANLTGLDYYPLLSPGERFPINDPTLPPRLDPRPVDDRIFFQGMLEGMARIEAEAYRVLRELGAPYPREVVAAGGGARNERWGEIRRALLGVPVTAALHDEAAYGTALLALRGVEAGSR